MTYKEGLIANVEAMTVSILIPVKGDNENLRKSIGHCLELDYPDFEIIVLPDAPIVLPYGDKVRVIPTGNVCPAKKRDGAIDKVKGELLAFLDDDAYPRNDWLKNAVIHFSANEVAAVCGPAITPDSDTLQQKASGFIYSSFLASGRHKRRYVPDKLCEVDDYPSCNFLVRKDVFQQVGGFDTTLWPGEDTILCLKITNELNKKIIYDPKVLVYHHRRPLFIPHLKQIKNYSLHRGYFVKRFPDTSLRLSYFIPSIFVLGLISGGIISIFFKTISFFYFGFIAVYLTLVAIELFRGISLGVFGVSMVFIGIVLTHLVYGFYFIRGLFSKRLPEE
ncbi:MAG: glycosyltransferase [Candidatus Omnitrophica bacterium]|nr:glycosyltransferase [Candidatus Omnitrophota bacterium]